MNIVISEPTFLFLNFVKDFQSLIVGVIGFIGVIITLIVNNHLLRRQERYIANQKMISISVAIATDLKYIAEGLTNAAKNAENQPSPAFFFGFDCSITFDTYDALVSDIGFLEQNVANKIVESRHFLRAFILKIKALESVDKACQIREFYDNQNSQIVKFQNRQVIQEVINLINGYSKKLSENSEFIYAQIKTI